MPLQIAMQTRPCKGRAQAGSGRLLRTTCSSQARRQAANAVARATCCQQRIARCVCCLRSAACAQDSCHVRKALALTWDGMAALTMKPYIPQIYRELSPMCTLDFTHTIIGTWISTEFIFR